MIINKSNLPYSFTLMTRILTVFIIALLIPLSIIGRDAPGVSRIKRAIALSEQAATATIKQLPTTITRTTQKPKSKRKLNTPLARNLPKRKIFSEMGYADLKKSRDAIGSNKKNSSYIKYTEQLIKLCDDMHERATLILELADALFDDGKLEKAADQYATFNLFYPGHSKSEYALYRAVLASFYRILSNDRDQTKTSDTIDLANKFLKEKSFHAYHDEVKKIKGQCFERLIENELYICDFYLKGSRFKAVEQRLAAVKEKMLPEAPGMETKIVNLQAYLTLAKAGLYNPTTGQISNPVNNPDILAQSTLPANVITDVITDAITIVQNKTVQNKKTQIVARAHKSKKSSNKLTTQLAKLDDKQKTTATSQKTVKLAQRF